MRIHIAARRSFPILRLVVAVLCLSGTMFPQASSEPSRLSLQQAATIRHGKEPTAQGGAGGYESCIGGVQEARSFLMPESTSQKRRHGVTIPSMCLVATFGSSVSPHE